MLLRMLFYVSGFYSRLFCAGTYIIKKCLYIKEVKDGDRNTDCSLDFPGLSGQEKSGISCKRLASRILGQ